MDDLGWCWVYGFKVVTDERPDVKHRPIMFKAPMVRAIMEGRKTTRRPLKPAPTLRDRVWSWSANRCGEGARWDNSITRGLERMLRRWSPFGQVGERLWVKETWAAVHFSAEYMDGFPTGYADDWYGSKRIPKDHQDGYWKPQYAADPCHEPCKEDRGWVWRSSIHMPRWASRLTLEIVSVRVERVEAISGEDAVAEGIRPFIGGPWGTYYAVAAEDEPHATAQAAFLGLWRSMYGS